MSRKIAASLANDIGTFVAAVRMIAEHNTETCLAYVAKGGAEMFARHTSEANVRNVDGAVKGKTFTAQKKLPWVHSVFSPLVRPIRDRDGDIVNVSKPSLPKLWSALERDGEVSHDLRAVADAAFTEGKVKRVWAGRFLMYAVASDLPALEQTARAVTTDSASLMKDLRKFRK